MNLYFLSTLLLFSGYVLATPSPSKVSLQLNPKLFDKREFILNTGKFGKYFARVDTGLDQSKDTQAVRTQYYTGKSRSIQGDIRLGSYVNSNNQVYMGFGIQGSSLSRPRPAMKGEHAFHTPWQGALDSRLGFEHRFLPAWSVSSELQTRLSAQPTSTGAPFRKAKLYGRAVLLNLKYSFQ